MGREDLLIQQGLREAQMRDAAAFERRKQMEAYEASGGETVTMQSENGPVKMKVLSGIFRLMTIQISLLQQIGMQQEAILKIAMGLDPDVVFEEVTDENKQSGDNQGN